MHDIFNSGLIFIQINAGKNSITFEFHRYDRKLDEFTQPIFYEKDFAKYFFSYKEHRKLYISPNKRNRNRDHNMWPMKVGKGKKG